MRFVYFTHSLRSCWNNGNAHFQRGILRALQALGHEAIAYETHANWSSENLIADQGNEVLAAFTDIFPDLPTGSYTYLTELPAILDGADVVIVHEWNDPALVAEVGRLRRQMPFTLLFHDTHHRAISDPTAIRRFDLSAYDGILAFGATLARIYEDWGWGNRVFVWHEAADTTLFHPPSQPVPRRGIVWVGNWGDGERSVELETFLLAPAQRAGVALHIHGVRYPQAALQMLQRYNASFNGWLANARVPTVFAQHEFTVHVPRRHYAELLPGIPTIRVFEALACGLPLITAPWEDTENLFVPGTDYLVARNGEEMEQHMRALHNDTALAQTLARSGLDRILSRHTCDIRALELLAILTKVSIQAEAA